MMRIEGSCLIDHKVVRLCRNVFFFNWGTAISLGLSCPSFLFLFYTSNSQIMTVFSSDY